jgi:hypothetical protein
LGREVLAAASEGCGGFTAARGSTDNTSYRLHCQAQGWAAATGLCAGKLKWGQR